MAAKSTLNRVHGVRKCRGRRCCQEKLAAQALKPYTDRTTAARWILVVLASSFKSVSVCPSFKFVTRMDLLKFLRISLQHIKSPCRQMRLLRIYFKARSAGRVLHQAGTLLYYRGADQKAATSRLCCNYIIKTPHLLRYFCIRHRSYCHQLHGGRDLLQ